MALDPDLADPAYSYQATAMGPPRSFRLSAGHLIWDSGRRSGRAALARIARVRLSYRPATMQSQRFVTEIWSFDAPKLTLISTSWKSMFEQVRLDREYRAFVTELLRRLADSPAAIRFDAGINPFLFGLGLVLFASAGVGMAGLIVRAIEADARTAAILIGLFLAMFVWQAGQFFYRNRPRSYAPNAPPAELLPTVKD